MIADKPSLDLDTQVIKFIQQHVDLFAGFKMGDDDESGEWLIYVMTPLSKYVKYMNGRVKRWYGFQIQAKAKSWRTAYDTLDQINSVIEDARTIVVESANGSFSFVKGTMRQNPASLGTVKDDGQNYAVYSASFQIEITI